MRGHNVCSYGAIRKIIFNYPCLPFKSGPLIFGQIPFHYDSSYFKLWYLEVNFLDQKIYFEISVVWAEFWHWDFESWPILHTIVKECNTFHICLQHLYIKTEIVETDKSRGPGKERPRRKVQAQVWGTINCQYLVHWYLKYPILFKK